MEKLKMFRPSISLETASRSHESFSFARHIAFHVTTRARMSPPPHPPPSIVDESLILAKQHNILPLSVVVLDAGGQIVAGERDGKFEQPWVRNLPCYSLLRS